MKKVSQSYLDHVLNSRVRTVKRQTIVSFARTLEVGEAMKITRTEFRKMGYSPKSSIYCLVNTPQTKAQGMKFQTWALPKKLLVKRIS